MSFLWTAHRFAGGALALDVANSVVLRFDPGRRIDRFADAAAMDTFAAAANLYGAERERFGPLLPAPPENHKSLLALREAIDRHFRKQVQDDARPDLLADLLETIAAVLRRTKNDHDHVALDVATAHSALSLVTNPEPDRLKICPNCEWLFFDRSRNRSRTWCDMAVCGNRTKAKRHYRRNKEGVQP
ncbi:putative RNA-binding Zn ribbon-like protein [Sinorhizobium kostiense]|uniref:RNA-binding Zn ribbon-like protein n=1 Tax=Sinorhizobium kostiense TaxID=76747 RepID=A0ABS4QWJ3_9HYPH|nr:CGNR zinc finger domain-containing protein [Sinorhizobium kostiense]MBP2235012.1 putative RNA-binding Zn ribbon-like protein [Sinorhizobium kostiense]